MTSLSSNRAGLAGLSAFWVARRRRSLMERRSWERGVEDVRADFAMCRCARVGGLKEESRT